LFPGAGPLFRAFGTTWNLPAQVSVGLSPHQKAAIVAKRNGPLRRFFCARKSPALAWRTFPFNAGPGNFIADADRDNPGARGSLLFSSLLFNRWPACTPMRPRPPPLPRLPARRQPPALSLPPRGVTARKCVGPRFFASSQKPGAKRFNFPLRHFSTCNGLRLACRAFVPASEKISENQLGAVSPPNTRRSGPLFFSCFAAGCTGGEVLPLFEDFYSGARRLCPPCFFRREISIPACPRPHQAFGESRRVNQPGPKSLENGPPPQQFLRPPPAPRQLAPVLFPEGFRGPLFPPRGAMAVESRMPAQRFHPYRPNPSKRPALQLSETFDAVVFGPTYSAGSCRCGGTAAHFVSGPGASPLELRFIRPLPGPGTATPLVFAVTRDGVCPPGGSDPGGGGPLLPEKLAGPWGGRNKPPLQNGTNRTTPNTLINRPPALLRFSGPPGKRIPFFPSKMSPPLGTADSVCKFPSKPRPTSETCLSVKSRWWRRAKRPFHALRTGPKPYQAPPQNNKDARLWGAPKTPTERTKPVISLGNERWGKAWERTFARPKSPRFF